MSTLLGIGGEVTFGSNQSNLVEAKPVVPSPGDTALRPPPAVVSTLVSVLRRGLACILGNSIRWRGVSIGARKSRDVESSMAERVDPTRRSELIGRRVLLRWGAAAVLPRRLHPAFSTLSLADMVAAGRTPLHPGAARYYRERGWSR
jgi:hypothetical protein